MYNFILDMSRAAVIGTLQAAMVAAGSILPAVVLICSGVDADIAIAASVAFILAVLSV